VLEESFAHTLKVRSTFLKLGLLQARIPGGQAAFLEAFVVGDGIIKIFADEVDELEFQGALPSTDALATRLHDVSSDVLQRNLSKLMGQVEALFASGADGLRTLSVKEVKVAVGVTASGEFSLLGLTKASAELEATFEITLTPKAKQG
jgi:hypothetical protein